MSPLSVPLPAEGAAALKAHKTKQAQEKLLMASEYLNQGLVFAKPFEEPASPGHVSQQCTVLLNRAKLPRVRMHDLRHTHAPLLLSVGVHSTNVSKRLGYSTIMLTLDTYSHVSPTMQSGEESTSAHKEASLTGTLTGVRFCLISGLNGGYKTT